MADKPYWNQVQSAIDTNMAQMLAFEKASGKKQTEKINKGLSGITADVTKNTKKNTKTQSDAVNGFMQKTVKTSEKSTTLMTKQFKKLFDDIEKMLKKTEGIFLKSKLFNPDAAISKKTGINLGGKGSGSMKVGGNNPIAAMAASMEVMTQLGGKLIPIVGTLGTIAGFIGAIVFGAIKLSASTQDFLRNLGGSNERLMPFLRSMTEIQKTTGMTDDQINNLARSFLAAGQPVSALDGKMTGLLKSAGMGVKMFEMSEDAAAGFTQSMLLSGMSLEGTNRQWDNMFQNMQRLGVTIQDVTASVDEAMVSFNSYGGTLNMTAGDFQKGILESKSLFKALNLEAGDTKRILGGVFGDVGMRQKQAQMIAAMGGMSAGRAFNLMGDNAAEGTKARASASMKWLSRQLGSESSTLGMGQDELKKYYGNTDEGESRRAQHTVNMARAKQFASSMGMDEGLFDKTLSGFQGFMKKGGGKGQSQEQAIDTYLNQAQNGMKATAKPATIQEGLTGVQNSVSGGLQKLGQEIGSMIRDMSLKLMEKWTQLNAWMGKMYPVMEKIGGFLTGAFGEVLNTIAGACTYLSEHFGAAPKDMGGIASVKDANPMDRGMNNLNQLGAAFNGKGNSNPFSNAAEWAGILTRGGIDGVKARLPQGGWNPLAELQNRLSGSNGGPASTAGAVGTGNAIGKQAWGGAAKNAAFRAKAIAVANALGMNPDHLMAVMQFESGMNPAARNKSSGATGLIQFMHPGSYGVNTQDPVAQLDSVYKYLKPHKGKMNNIQDAYMSVFSPAFMGKSANTTMYSSGSKAYAQNQGLDVNGDGNITVGEAASFPASKLQQYKSLSGDTEARSLLIELQRQTAIGQQQLQISKDTKDHHEKEAQKKELKTAMMDPHGAAQQSYFNSGNA